MSTTPSVPSRFTEPQASGGLMAVVLFSSDATLVPRLIGAGAIIIWAFGTSYLVFKAFDMTVGMRVTRDEEIVGLDASEHGSDAYPEFVFQHQVADLNRLIETQAETVEVPAKIA